MSEESSWKVQVFFTKSSRCLYKILAFSSETILHFFPKFLTFMQKKNFLWNSFSHLKKLTEKFSVISLLKNSSPAQVSLECIGVRHFTKLTFLNLLTQHMAESNVDEVLQEDSVSWYLLSRRIFELLFQSICVVSFWRNTWYLLDLYATLEFKNTVWTCVFAYFFIFLFYALLLNFPDTIISKTMTGSVVILVQL